MDTLSTLVCVPLGVQYVETIYPYLEGESNGTTEEAAVSSPCSQSKRLYAIES